MGLFEPHHLILILVIALIIFGPGKIADLGGSLGRGVRDFKKAMDTDPTPAPVAQQAVQQQAAQAEAGPATAAGTVETATPAANVHA